MNLIDQLKQKIEGKHIKVVYPEGSDERIVKAAVRLAQDNLADPIILGTKEEVEAILAKHQMNLPDNVEIIDPKTYPDNLFDEMLDSFLKRRAGKNTADQGREWLRNVNNYFGTMLVYMKKADCMVSGAINPTGDTVRPALQLIKTKPSVSRRSRSLTLGKDFGATEIVSERDDAAIEHVMQLTNNVGADAVLECVGAASRNCLCTSWCKNRTRWLTTWIKYGSC